MRFVSYCAREIIPLGSFIDCHIIWRYIWRSRRDRGEKGRMREETGKKHAIFFHGRKKNRRDSVSLMRSFVECTLTAKESVLLVRNGARSFD